MDGSEYSWLHDCGKQELDFHCHVRRWIQNCRSSKRGIYLRHYKSLVLIDFEVSRIAGVLVPDLFHYFNLILKLASRTNTVG